jgi:hypothetical protein
VFDDVVEDVLEDVVDDEDVELEVEVVDDEEDDERTVDLLVEELLTVCDVDAEELVWLFDADDWLEVGAEVELRAKYPPTAATTTITAIAAATVVLTAFRPLRGDFGVFLDCRGLGPNLF